MQNVCFIAEEKRRNDVDAEITNTVTQSNPLPLERTKTFAATQCVSDGSGGCEAVESSVFQSISEQMGADDIALDTMLLTCVSGTLRVGEKKMQDIYPFFFRTPYSSLEHEENTESGGVWSRQLHAELSGWLNPALLPCPATRRAALRILSVDVVDATNITNRLQHSRITQQLHISWNLSIRVTITADIGNHPSYSPLSKSQSRRAAPLTTPAEALAYTTDTDASESSSMDLGLFGSSSSRDVLVDEVD